jgi:hypothetical protein
MKTFRLIFAVVLLSIVSTACSSPLDLPCDGVVCHEPDGGSHEPDGGS